MANSNLGLYDMVLALSESKINDEIEILYDRKVIKRRWMFLMDYVGKNFLNQSDSNFETVKSSWLKSVDLKREIRELDSKLDALEDESDSSYERLYRERLSLARELKKLKIGIDYEMLIDAEITSPAIEMLEDEHFTLLFVLNIKKGFIHYLDKSEIKKVALNGSRYAFKVPVNKIEIDSENMKYVDPNLKKKVEGSMFSIHSIFLDFQRADIAAYNEEKSKLPNDIHSIQRLQLAINSYFKSLAGAENPYILGYSITNEIKEAKKAELEPTFTSFSTSRAGKKQQSIGNEASLPAADLPPPSPLSLAGFESSVPVNNTEENSSFNFLMQIKNHPSPKIGNKINAGIIPRPLVKTKTDEPAVTNGALAINYHIFENEFLTPIHDKVSEIFQTKFRSSFSENELTFVPSGNNLSFRIAKSDFFMDFGISREIFTVTKSDQSQFLRIFYNLSANGTYHQELKTSFSFIPAGTVGTDQDFSTSGDYVLGDYTGSKGHLIIDLVPKNDGGIKLDSSFKNPTLGKNTEKPRFKDKHTTVMPFVSISTEDWYKLSKSIPNPWESIPEFKELYRDNEIVDVRTFNSVLFENFKFESLNDFSNKIILPGSNVFAFKNIRLLKGDLSADDVVLFDIAYAPATA